MDGYDEALLILSAILLCSLVVLVVLVAKAKRLDASIRKHEAMLADEKMRARSGILPAE